MSLASAGDMSCGKVGRGGMSLQKNVFMEVLLCVALVRLRVTIPEQLVQMFFDQPMRAACPIPATGLSTWHRCNTGSGPGRSAATSSLPADPLFCARRQLQALGRQQAPPDRIRIQQGVQLCVVTADVPQLCVPHRWWSGGEDDECTLWSDSDIVGALQ